jgi:hypothetical protein
MNIRPILKTYLPDINELKYEIDKLKNAPNDQNNSSTVKFKSLFFFNFK